MIFKKISHGILVAGLAFVASTPCASHAAGPGIPLSDNHTLALARIILGSAGIIIGGSQIYANKEGKTKQQKRNTLIGGGFLAAGAAALIGPELYARITAPKRSGLITKPLPQIPGTPKVKHPWKQWFNNWLDRIK